MLISKSTAVRLLRPETKSVGEGGGWVGVRSYPDYLSGEQRYRGLHASMKKKINKNIVHFEKIVDMAKNNTLYA